MNQKVLEEIGLTRGEIRVYLTLLKIGETTTGKIIEQSGLSSGKIYEIIDKLIKKGLVSFIVKEKTKYFQACSPNRLKDYLYEKENEIKSKEKELEKELPSLLETYNSKLSENNSVLFKGLKGIQTAIFQALDEMTKDDEVLAMGIISSKDEKYNILWEKWHNERVSRKIKCKMIFSEKGEYYKTLGKMKPIDLRVIQKLTPSPVDILGNKVLIFTYGQEPSCLYIENAEIAKSFKSFFETIWKISQSSNHK